MRNLIVSTYMTLDGKIDDVREWSVPCNDPGSVKHHTDLLANSDGLLLGRKTYELFAAMWPPRAGEFATWTRSTACPSTSRRRRSRTSSGRTPT